MKKEKTMKQIFTPNHLLLAAYGELAPAATHELQSQIFDNETLSNSLQEILDMQIALDELSLKPSNSSIKIILENCHEAEAAF